MGYWALNGMVLTGPDEFGVRWTVDPEQVQGWDGPASRIALIPKSNTAGSWTGDAHADARHVVIGGTCQAPDEAALLSAQERLEAACAYFEVPLERSQAGSYRWVNVQREGRVIFQRKNPKLANWSVSVVSGDGRKFGETLTGSTPLPSTTGGITYPVKYPLMYTGVTNSGQINLTNPGNDAGPVIVRIDGPSNPLDPPLIGPVVTHVASGLSLVFSTSLELRTGEFITVDMEAQEVLAQGLEGRNQWVTGRGFSQFQPGANAWSFTAAGFSASARLTVSAIPAW